MYLLFSVSAVAVNLNVLCRVYLLFSVSAVAVNLNVSGNAVAIAECAFDLFANAANVISVCCCCSC